MKLNYKKQTTENPCVLRVMKRTVKQGLETDVNDLRANKRMGWLKNAYERREIQILNGA